MGSDRKRFPRLYRLTRPSEYQDVFRNAHRYKCRNFTILARKNRIGYARLGITISKKILAKAVKRNRIKRVIRESFRLHRHKLNDCDLVVIGQVGVGERPGQQLRADLEKRWIEIEQWLSS